MKKPKILKLKKKKKKFGPYFQGYQDQKVWHATQPNLSPMGGLQPLTELTKYDKMTAVGATVVGATGIINDHEL